MKPVSQNTAITVFALTCLAMATVIIWRAASGPRTGANENLEAHPVRQIAFWESELSKPIEARVFAAPPEVLDYLHKDNQRQGWKEIPKAAAIPTAIEDLKAALAGLPEELRRKLEPKLASVLVASEIGGSAIANTIYGEDGRPTAAFLTLDANVLDRRANEWATWRESSPFQQDKRFRLRARIAEDEQDTKIRAYQYILLHEIGHVLSVRERVHPSWDFGVKREPLDQYPFATISWSEKDGEISRPKEFGGLSLPFVHYYASQDERRVPAEKMKQIYEALENSGFATLYGSTNVFDDFAETFATYVHSRILGRPFRIELLDGETAIKTFDLCYGEPRCAEKERMIREFYENL